MMKGNKRGMEDGGSRCRMEGIKEEGRYKRLEEAWEGRKRMKTGRKIEEDEVDEKRK